LPESLPRPNTTGTGTLRSWVVAVRSPAARPLVFRSGWIRSPREPTAAPTAAAIIMELMIALVAAPAAAPVTPAVAAAEPAAMTIGIAAGMV
jgi:hypothetical protein